MQSVKKKITARKWSYKDLKYICSDKPDTKVRTEFLMLKKQEGFPRNEHLPTLSSSFNWIGSILRKRKDEI